MSDNKKPNIRFKGYSDDWEQRKVGELIKDGIIDAPLDGNHGEKHPTASEYVDSGIPFLMASDVHGGIADIKSCKFITRERAERLDKGFAKNGDVLLTHKATIGESAILQGLETEYAVLTPQVTYYRIQDEKKLSREYLYAFFNSVKFQNDLKTKAAQSTRPYIGISAQQNLDIVLPRKLTEQKKIGVYFSDLDHLITLHQRKYNKLQTLKKAMLEKMFPKNGSNVPEIRFKGFTDAWEQRKFGEVLETVTDYVAAGSFADLAKNVEYKDYPDYAQLIRTKDLKNGFTSTQEVYVNKNAFDYLYRVNMDKECIILPNIGNCGEVYYVKPESLPYEHNVLGPNAIFVRSETCANNFLSILFQAKDFQTKLKLIVSPNGQTKFNKTELKGIDLILPRDVYEQEKIGQYFSNLDRLITLHQRELEKLQNIKKAMLEKMFV